MKRFMVCICAALLLCSASAVWAKGDTLIVANPSDAKTLDPHQTAESSSNTAMRQIYESLVMFNSKHEITPMMAERWEVLEDGKAYKFYLRKGVKFHNGEEMTADDVVFTFKRATGPGTSLQALAGYIDPKGIEKVDDYTVILRTTQPMGTAFLASMNHPWASILNKKAVEAAGKDYGMQPVGTGKFKFVSWDKGDKIVFEKFDGYYGEKPKINKMILRTVVEASSRTIELESGAVDVAQDMAAIDIKRVKENPRLRVAEQPGQRVYYLGFDVTKKPYDDLRVRQAMNMVINRPGIVKAVYKGHAEVSTGPTSSAILYSKTKETPAPAIDIAKAKKLLAEAGYPDGFKAELLTADRSDFTAISTILQENLQKIGIKMDIKVYEWGAYIDVIKRPGHDPYVMNWWGGAPALDPFFFMNPPFHSNSPATTNRFFYKNPELDALLNKGAALNDGPERKAVYSQAWDILVHDLPWVSLASPNLSRGHVKELQGVDFNPSFIVYYGDAYFDAK